MLAACEAASGAALAEVVRAGAGALPEGREAVDAALDEAMLEWKPELEDGGRALGVAARVSTLSGVLVGALALGSAFGKAEETGGSLTPALEVGLGTALLALCIGIASTFVSILARGLVRRAERAARVDLEKAVGLLTRASEAWSA